MKVDEGVMMPRRATTGSCGYDFFAPRDIVIKRTLWDKILRRPAWVEVGTGVYLDGTEEVRLPVYEKISEMIWANHGNVIRDWYMLMLPKSGLGFKYGVRLANTAGVIDKDYRGEIRAKITAWEDLTIPAGKAFMQGVIIPFGVLVGEESPTKERGTGGFGSTGQ